MSSLKKIQSSLVLVFLLVVLPAENEAMRTSGRGPIQDAIQSGAAAEYNKDDCTWRRGNDRDSCPDPDVHVYLYTPGKAKRPLDSRHSDWLRKDYEPTRENIILIHGYAGMWKFLTAFLSLKIAQLSIFC